MVLLAVTFEPTLSGQLGLDILVGVLEDLAELHVGVDRHALLDPNHIVPDKHQGIPIQPIDGVDYLSFVCGDVSGLKVEAKTKKPVSERCRLVGAIILRHFGNLDVGVRESSCRRRN